MTPGTLAVHGRCPGDPPERPSSEAKQGLLRVFNLSVAGANDLRLDVLATVPNGELGLGGRLSEQVANVFPVQLQKLHLDGELVLGASTLLRLRLLQSLKGVEERAEGSRYDSSLARVVHVGIVVDAGGGEGIGGGLAEDGVCLATSRLAVRDHSRVVALEASIDEGPHAVAKDLALRRLGSEGGVECEGVGVGVVAVLMGPVVDFDRLVRQDVHAGGVSGFEGEERSNADCHLYSRRGRGDVVR